jgi:hypothetical protein
VTPEQVTFVSKPEVALHVTSWGKSTLSRVCVKEAICDWDGINMRESDRKCPRDMTVGRGSTSCRPLVQGEDGFHPHSNRKPLERFW